MKTYFLNIWDTLRSSYWFIPSILVLIAFIFSIAFPYIDNEIANYEFHPWIKTTTDAARATLSTITGAMVAVTGTVFSITIVTLSLTSQLFGPRLLRTFMLDRVTQVTLGIFLSTALYSVLVLRIVEKSSDGPGPPHLSVLFAVFLMVISVGMLIAFIHHVAILIQAPRIVENVANDLNDAITRLFPDNLEDKKDCDLNETSNLNFEIEVYSKKEGYIQGFNIDQLTKIAKENDFKIKFFYKPGDFIPLDGKLAITTYNSDKSLNHKINDSIIVGMRRTPRQDIECAINELVEVAVRSLSPGINDPFTAMNCIDRLSGGLRKLTKKAIPSIYYYDNEKKLRIILKAIDFPSILDASFNQIRQYSEGSVAVTIRLLEGLLSISLTAKRSEDKKAIKKHAKMVYNLSESIYEQRDKDDIKERYNKILEYIGSPKNNLCK